MKPKLYLINGPLGAGKTTILKELIKQARFENARIIENEFASTSIDTEQLHDHHAEVQTIAGLCICCSTGNELVGALTNLSSGQEPVIIEATGVANSLQLVEKIVAYDLLESYDLAQSIFVLDAPEANDATLESYIDELKAADIILITKPDLVSDPALSRLVTTLTGKGIKNIHTVLNGAFDPVHIGNQSQILDFFADYENEFQPHDTSTNYTIIDTGGNQLENDTLQAAWPLLVRRYKLRRMKGNITDNGDILHIEATTQQVRVTKGDEAAPTKLVLIGEDARSVTLDTLLQFIKEKS